MKLQVNNIQKSITYLYFFILILSIISLSINYYILQYPGNNYYPPNTLYIGIVTLLMFLGSILQFGQYHNITKQLKEVFRFFLIMALIAFATNAVQYTPFIQIDEKLLSLDIQLSVHLTGIIEWVKQYPLLQNILWLSYNALPYQMGYLPLIIIVTKRYETLQEYYFLLLTSTIIGFTFYYFFPSAAPSSILSDSLFTKEQLATSIKFNELHHYIIPSTNEGGLISFPSFHIIWAWYCLNLVRRWALLFYTLLPLNLLLMMSCVMLGWHYFVDVIGASIVIGLSHYFYKKLKPSIVNQSVIQFQS